MNCPKCGTQNSEDAQVCISCNSPLAQPPEPAESVKVKTSRLAIVSLILGILTLCAFAFILVAMLGIRTFVIPFIFTAALALILGIISLVQIGLSAGRIVGKGIAVIGIMIPVLLYTMLIVIAFLARTRCVAFPNVCGSNLSGIGRAMLIYANDYDNSFPRAGGPTSKWGTTHNWQADLRIDAFGLKPDHTGGSATISASLYFLIKYAELTPERFVCKGNPRTTEFRPRKYGARGKKLYDFWDFGPEPAKHYSYSYHIPYGPYSLNTTSSEPGMAVVADRNPWLDPYTDTTGFKWDDKTKTGPPEDIRGYQKGNSGPHQREGQNVLFVDNHVYFENQSFCGVKNDNIYTYWNGSDIRQGAPPTLTSQPADKLDSLLVNDLLTEPQK